MHAEQDRNRPDRRSMGLLIAGTGSSLPERIVTNQELAAHVDTSDEWIVSRTGIRERHVASSHETLTVFGEEAAKKAIASAGISPEDIELIIVATATDGNVTPSTACQIQALIGAKHAVCFDLNAACSGFLYSLHVAEALMKADGLRTALVIGGDLVTHYVDWTDRSTCILFGDAAGAVVLQESETESGILQTVLGSDGSKGDSLVGRTDPEDHFIRMNGQEVFRFAVRTVPRAIEAVLKKAGIEKSALRYYILHQANARIIEAVARQLGEPMDKFPMNLSKTANTSAGSIPVLLDEMRRENRLERGDLCVLAGFGGGLTWGASVIRY